MIPLVSQANAASLAVRLGWAGQQSRCFGGLLPLDDR